MDIGNDLTEVLSAWRNKQALIFVQNGWFGGAAGVANRQIQARIKAMADTVDALNFAADFYKKAAETVVATKQAIIDVADAAQNQIDDLAKESRDNGPDRTNEINSIVSQAHENCSKLVESAGKSLERSPAKTPGSEGDKPTSYLTNDAGDDLLKHELESPHEPPNIQTDGQGAADDYKFDAPSDVPSDVPVVAPTGHRVDDDRTFDNPNHTQTQNPTLGRGAQDGIDYRPETPSTRSDYGPTTMTPATPGGGRAGGGGGDGTSPPSNWFGKGESSGKVGDSAGKGLDGSKVGDEKSGKDSTSMADARPLTPMEQQQRMLDEMSKGLAKGGGGLPVQPMVPNASLTPPVQPHLPVEAPPPAAASAPPVTPPAPSLGGGAASGFSGAGSAPVSAPSGGMATPPMPLGSMPAPPPMAAPVTGGGGQAGAGAGAGTGASSGNAAGQNGPNVNAASTNASPAAAAAPAPIPVSAARLERDAVASAAAAGATKRQKDRGNDPLTYARRVAAALNVGVADFGFYWVTGLCADGTIIVANSYGLGYIPDGVNLPTQVKLVSADESIPLTDRARWATYPVLALQGWAQAHSLKLRAVIATEAQFANFDPGAAKVVLRPDDIPTTGKIDGLSRLEVIAPEAAARLASVSDAGLRDLLPPAHADPEPPSDNTVMLWFDVAKPLMSTLTDRGAAHLEAFITYADHAQELALYRAHTAADAAAMRAAIADWVYWQHLAVLISDAVAAEVPV